MMETNLWSNYKCSWNRICFAESSYSISAINDSNYRPSQTTYPNGYFNNDYVYDESGDLDEFNGKFTQLQSIQMEHMHILQL